MDGKEPDFSSTERVREIIMDTKQEKPKTRNGVIDKATAGEAKDTQRSHRDYNGLKS